MGGGGGGGGERRLTCCSLSLSEVDTVEKLKAFMDSEAPSVVGWYMALFTPLTIALSTLSLPSPPSLPPGFFTDVEGALAKAFGTVAGGLRENFRFVHSYEAAVLTEFGYSE